MRSRRATVVALPLLATLLLGCGVSAEADRAAPAAGGARVPVVAAEKFYADLARQVGGDRVSVMSVLSNPDADPHLFEPGSRAALAVANARVVIVNGAGYDGWMNRLLAAAPSARRAVVTVADVLGVRGTDPNPHLWYDVPGLPRIVHAVGDALATVDPAHAAGYRAGIQRTIRSLRSLLDAVATLKAQFSGAPVAYTERVPGLLLAAAGLRVLTPPGFARAVEDGTDPVPADVAVMQRLLTARAVRVLLYNVQAATPVTARLRQVARAAGVPVVAVTEMPPTGSTFLSWQLAQVRALAAALQR